MATGSTTRLTRRQAIGTAAALGVTAAAGELALSIPGIATAGAATPGTASAKAVALPSPQQVRADFQRMVDFGPRLTGSDPHNAYIAWLEQELTAAGLTLLPCDTYMTERWLAEDVELTLLESTLRGPVKVASAYPRSQETTAAGVTGPLVYAGTLPAPSVSGADMSAFQEALAAYPTQAASWVAGLSGTLGNPQGSIMLVDLPAPPPATTALFTPPYATYLNWPDHGEADWLTPDYKRPWTVPGVAGVPTTPFQALGAVGVIFIVDASYEAFKGCYGPFEAGFEPLPALYVDRDTGAKLRAASATRPSINLKLTASRAKVPSAAVTAVLPGTSPEVMIFNTHTDGQGMAEENGGVAFVHLARYFASLPPEKRLKRTLVFALWPGHMSADLPQAQGWINAHPDLMKRAAAALTVEHLGCAEWDDKLDGGYGSTGLPEAWAIWTTQGTMFDTARQAVVDHALPRTALMRPPGQFGVGGAFQSYGIPQIGAIAGPYYLITVSENGDMDKLDEKLAAQQIGFIADLATRLDAIPAEQLRQGDPTLGYGGAKTGANTAAEKVCGPSEPAAPAAPGPTAPGSPAQRTGGAIAGCPSPTGRLDGINLGPLRLGMSRSQAAHAMPHSRRNARRNEETFCLSPVGVRAGYASAALLRTLPRDQRSRWQDRIVWLSTANRHYELGGVRPGMTLPQARRHVHVANPVASAGATIYTLALPRAVGFLAVRGGIVTEIGLAVKTLARPPHARALLRSIG